LKSNHKEVLAVLTSNRNEVLASCGIQTQAKCKKPQEFAGLRMQKEVLACALYLGCTITALYSASTAELELVCSLKTNHIQTKCYH